jgi:succinyl-CoA synthetase beta subunit
MRMAEADGKALLRRHGLAVPRGVLLRPGEGPPAETASWPGFFLKAQVLENGRSKNGLVRYFQTTGDLRDARRLILATLDDADTPLLLEEAIPVVRETRVAARGDGTWTITESAGISQALATELARYAGRLVEIAREEGLDLIAIDPLGLTEDGRLVACDVTIVRGDGKPERA